MNYLKTTYKITLLAACVLLAGSCKKEIIPPPGSTSPVFVASGTFGGEAVSLNAGDDNVTMSTQSTQQNGVDFYEGILGNSQFKIDMGIFAGDIDMENPSLPDFQNIHELSFASMPGGAPIYKIVKDSFPNRELIHQIQWEVNGEMKGLDVLEINQPGKYQVCAHVTFSDYTVETICNEVIVGFKTSADFELNFFLGQDHSFKSWVKTFGSNVQSVKWFDGTQEIDNSEILNTTLSSERHFIRAEILFANGVKRSKTVLIDGALTGFNIYDFTKPGLAPLFLWDYTAKVKVTKDGVDYYSHNTPNSTNRITVDNITYYGVNEDGDNVYILNGKVNVNLKSAAGVVKLLKMDISFGFAVK